MYENNVSFFCIMVLNDNSSKLSLQTYGTNAQKVVSSKEMYDK